MGEKRMDNESKNCILVCGRKTGKELINHGGEIKDCLLIAGWIPDEDARVWLIDADKWDKLMGEADVLEKEETAATMEG